MKYGWFDWSDEEIASLQSQRTCNNNQRKLEEWIAAEEMHAIYDKDSKTHWNTILKAKETAE